MLFYWLLLITISLIAWKTRNKDRAYKAIAFILLFLGSTRADTVGTDIIGYSHEFSTIGLDPKTWGLSMYQFEVGFCWLMSRFKYYISDNSLFFFHALFFLTFIIQLRFIKRFCKYRSLALVLMVGWAYYFSYFNIMREKLCFALITGVIFLYFYKPVDDYEVEDKFINARIKNVILIVVVTLVCCYLIHKSMAILLLTIPLYLYYDSKIFQSKYLAIAVAVSCIFGYTIALRLAGEFQQIAYLFEDDKSNIAGYLSYDENIGLFSQISNILNSVFAIMVIYFHRYKKDYFLLFYLLGIILLNVLTPISWIFQRIGNTFAFFRIVTYSNLWFEIPDKKERWIYRISLVLFTIVIYQNRLINDNESDVVPYVNALIGNLFD